MKLKLTTGIEIDQPLQLISTYYKEHAHILYDILQVPLDNQIDPACLSALAFFQSENPKLADWRELWERKKELEAPLCRIPAELSLVESDIPWDSLEDLFRGFLDLNGFRVSRASKILHKKRPYLIPILDERRVVKTFYAAALKQWISALNEFLAQHGQKYRMSKDAAAKTARAAVYLVRELREDILQNLNVLQEIKQELDTNSLKLSLVRIFDIILWEYAPKLP